MRPFQNIPGSIALMILFLFLISGHTGAQERALTHTGNSPYARLRSINIGDVQWTNGFWAERFDVCRTSMIPHMMGCYLNDSISHAFKNFEIAAGLDTGRHEGPPFHDGDFYKILEAGIMAYAATGDQKTGAEIDRIIDVIAKAQRRDGYIHTPVLIQERNEPDKKHAFVERLDFETYNLGHLMTAACLHYRTTGKRSLLDVAIKATDFLYAFYQRNPYELAQNAICPSHYMGVVEMYRTTRDSRYLELAKGLIEIRSMVKEGTDHNQDRIPFKQQTNAVGHAVRANYLYAGAADVYAETGDDSLLTALQKIWHDVTEHKMYITGGCGALYDGVSPNGTSYTPEFIQQVHQAYGRDYELPNITAHNESCANIGNLLWNWRMLQITGDPDYAEVMETILYNSLLAGVSLDGKSYFYTNPLASVRGISDSLRWSKHREPYISYCNCCPPNTIRTIAEIQHYIYSVSDEGLWIHLYGGNRLNTTRADGKPVCLTQETDYPWEGKIKITVKNLPDDFSLFLRIPQWADQTTIKHNGKAVNDDIEPGEYFELKNKWAEGDVIEIRFSMEPKLVEAHPLIEETRNQVAVKRGPVVYCLESTDIPKETRIFDFMIPDDVHLKPVKTKIGHSALIALEGELWKQKTRNWEKRLYREISPEKPEPIPIRLIPYYAWDNRGLSEMSVWIPLAR
jgi:uncharacterized protein